MSITRDIIVDLLPLYAAGEASAETRAAVEQHLAQDATLVALLRALETQVAAASPEGVPETLEKQIVARTRRVVNQRGLTLGLALWLTLLPFTIVIGGGDGGITFVLVRDLPQIAWVCWTGAALLWFHYIRVARRLRRSGL
jgi:anti-sigma factor RsiW